MKANSLLSGSLVYLAASVFAAGMPFLLLPILTRYMSSDEFGIVGIYQGLYTLFLAVCGLGVSGAVVRQSYDVVRERIGVYIFNVFLILGATCITLFIVLWLIHDWLGSLLKIPSDLLFYALFAAAMVFILNILLGQYQVNQRPQKYAIFQVGHSMVNIVFSIVGVIFLSAGAMGRIGGIVLAAGVFGFAALYTLRVSGRLQVQLDSNDIRSALRFGVPLMPHELGTFLLNWLSLFILNRAVGASEVGIYLLAFQISMILGVICDAFNKAFVPWLFSRLQQNDPEVRSSIVRMTYAYFLGLVIIVIAAFALSPVVIRVVFDDGYAEASSYVGWLVLGQALGGAYLVVTNYIFYMRRTEVLSLITLSGGVVNVLLLIIFVPEFGIVGAIGSFLVARLLIFLLTWRQAHRLVPMPWDMWMH